MNKILKSVIGLIALLASIGVHAQGNVTISGKVLDFKTKEALIGVSVVIEGTNEGTITI